MAGNRLKEVQVLIVDDQKLIQRLVFNILTALGFRAITIGSSGREAIDLVSRQTYDLIITDWRMGDLDGIDLIRHVRHSPNSITPHIPIILLTGNAELSDITEARDAGVNEYVIKPFSAEQLVKRIQSVIERPRSFVKAPSYSGPDRRHRQTPPPQGAERRGTR